MKTTISIIAGIVFGFAGTAMAFECPREMTDDNCERAKAEAEGKQAQIESDTPTDIRLAQPTGHGGFFGGPNAAKKAETMTAGNGYQIYIEEREDGKYSCRAHPHKPPKCQKIINSASSGEWIKRGYDTLLASTFSHIENWTEEREDGVYYCKVQIDTDGNMMGEPSCYLTTTARIYCDAKGNCTSPGQGKSASSTATTLIAGVDKGRGSFTQCDSGQCVTCTAEGCHTSQAPERTMVAHLRIGDLQDAGCQTTWECFGNTDTSPLIRHVNPAVFAAVYGSDE